MDQKALIAIVIAIIAIVVVVAVLVYEKRRRRERLHEKYGPEYDRLLQQHGDPQRAETILSQREKRVSHLKLHALPPAERQRYLEQWTFVQKQFVDDPRGAVIAADNLVTDVMNARGYPMTEFNQRAEDISVNYPLTVQNYRAAHDIVLRHNKGEASTEDLRRAMVHFRSLFEELLGSSAQVHKEVVA